MALPEKERIRPGQEADSQKIVTTISLPSVPRPTHTLDDLDALAAHVAGTFVVVVEVAAGKYRRRCYLTAKAAQNAARNATERGENATVYLAELKPLWKIAGGGQA